MKNFFLHCTCQLINGNKDHSVGDNVPPTTNSPVDSRKTQLVQQKEEKSYQPKLLTESLSHPLTKPIPSRLLDIARLLPFLIFISVGILCRGVWIECSMRTRFELAHQNQVLISLNLVCVCFYQKPLSLRQSVSKDLAATSRPQNQSRTYRVISPRSNLVVFFSFFF